jgi:hypothetical protein
MTATLHRHSHLKIRSDAAVVMERSWPDGSACWQLWLLNSLVDLKGQSKPKPEANPEPRRRLSFIPPFFNRSCNNPRRVQGSPVPDDFGLTWIRSDAAVVMERSWPDGSACWQLWLLNSLDAKPNEASTPTIKRVRSPTKAMTPGANTNDRDSPFRAQEARWLWRKQC